MNARTSWVRVESSTLDPDLVEGLAARVADPLWLLARQWQVGEFTGEDAANPLLVRLSARSVVLDRLTHWHHTTREWIKKITLMDGAVEAHSYDPTTDTFVRLWESHDAAGTRQAITRGWYNWTGPAGADLDDDGRPAGRFTRAVAWVVRAMARLFRAIGWILAFLARYTVVLPCQAPENWMPGRSEARCLPVLPIRKADRKTPSFAGSTGCPPSRSCATRKPVKPRRPSSVSDRSSNSGMRNSKRRWG